MGELSEPVVITTLVWVAPQVTDILNKHERRIEFLVVVRLSIRRVEDEVGSSRVRRGAVYNLVKHARAAAIETGESTA